MRRAEMMEWVQELTEKEQTVIMSRFGLDGSEAKTLEEIGREMGLTRERVRQMKWPPWRVCAIPLNAKP